MTKAKARLPCLENIISHPRKENKTMAKREAMKESKDRKVYTQTAQNVKKINVKPKLSRGGIRL